MTEPATCVCGALMNSEDCRLRAHTRGPRRRFPVDPEGHEFDEREAFEYVVTYHYRAAADRCACGELPLGSSFPRHQWDEFVKRRSDTP